MWLSLVERCVRDAEVEGSNPFSPTTRVIMRAVFNSQNGCSDSGYIKSSIASVSSPHSGSSWETTSYEVLGRLRRLNNSESVSSYCLLAFTSVGVSSPLVTLHRDDGLAAETAQEFDEPAFAVVALIEFLKDYFKFVRSFLRHSYLASLLQQRNCRWIELGARFRC